MLPHASNSIVRRGKAENDLCAGPGRSASRTQRHESPAPLAPPEGRSCPDVRTCGVFLFANADEPGVDAMCGDDRSRIGQHVGGGEADGSATLVSDHDLTPEYVRTSKEARSLGHISFRDKGPYTRGADTVLHSGTTYLNGDGRPACLMHEPKEVLEIARSPVPETKILADYNHLGPYLPHQHVLHKLFWV